MPHAETRDAKPRALFVIEGVVTARSRGYRYLCGSCGLPLISHPTREALDFTLACKAYGTVNDAPFATKSA